MRLKRQWQAFVRRISAIGEAGWRGGYSLLKYQALDLLGGGRPVKMRSRYSRYPLLARRRSSDAKVFYDIFAKEEYAPLNDLQNIGLIIDCGANVGYSSAYFLSRYPDARVIAVEPDPGNFSMLQQNLRPWSDQVRLVQSGVWSHPCGLVFSEERLGDGREWGIMVREAREGETPAMTAVDIGTLLRESGQERISLLKVDIERAEQVVFADNYDSWIDRVDNIAIELHNPECQRVFFAAIEGKGFDVSTSRELTICKKKPAA